MALLDLMVYSFQAIGQDDSARYYLGIYQSMFPYLDIVKYGFNTGFETRNNSLSKTKNNDMNVIPKINIFNAKFPLKSFNFSIFYY